MIVKSSWLLMSVLFLFIFSIHFQLAINLSVQKRAYYMIASWSEKLFRYHSQDNNSTNTTDKKTIKEYVKYSVNTTYLPLCPENSPYLVGSKNIICSLPISSKFDKMFPWVMTGGRSIPEDCRARHHVAILIPFRDRDSHLRTFLYNIHPFLRRQQLDYGIYIIEQVGRSKFNRAMLMNIGYVESIKLYNNYTCFIFHDVDLLPEDDRNLYTCSNQPRHLSVAIDKFKYRTVNLRMNHGSAKTVTTGWMISSGANSPPRLPYDAIFGGASAVSRDQFRTVNGYSNKFFGWGGEDDDMWNRLKHANYNVTRYPADIARYKMLTHGQEKGNKQNKKRYRLLREGYKRFNKDGLNSLKYKLINIQLKPLYTKISVDIKESEVMKSSSKSILG